MPVDRDAVYEFRDVGFYYGRVKALDGLSLVIEPGSFYGVLGPNGSGKTTLLDLMIGVKRPREGSVRYLGLDIDRYGRRELAREIALVPQDFYVNFPFTVQEIVLMGRHPYIPRFAYPSTHDLEIVETIMRDLKIDRIRDKYITELSGGERQRVIFARALAQDTPVLLLDEGTSNMDIRYSLDVLDIVADRVKARHRTVIAALHNLGLAASYCDRLIFMKAGRAVVQGDTEDVLTRENIRRVFEIDCHVYLDDYSGSKQVVFRRRKLS